MFEAGGSCGVSFFFVLSGFVMAWGYGDKVLAPGFSFARYMEKRLVRLYPLHLVCLLCAAVMLYSLNGADIRGLWWGPNLLLLQSWVPLPGVYFSGNAVSWCLSDLLFFYALFPMLWRRMSTSALFSRSGAVQTALFVTAYTTVATLLPEAYGNTVLYIFPLFRLPDFLLGIYACRLYTTCTEWNGWPAFFRSGRGVALELSAVGAVAISCGLFYVVPTNFSYTMLFWPSTAFFIIVFALSSQYGGRIARCFSGRLWVWLGNISFAFYMVHQLCIRCGEALNGTLSPTSAVLCFDASLAAAVLLHYAMEKPVVRQWQRIRR